LSARKKDGKRIGFLKTGDKLLGEILSPLQCAVLSVPPHKGFTLPAMVEILQQWNLYNRTKEHYNNYKELKDVLHHPRQSLGKQRKSRCGESLKGPLVLLIDLQMRVKMSQDDWNIFELMELQELLPDNQLLIVEVKPSDHSCHFLFVGPTAPDSIFILKEGFHFHGLFPFFEKYCFFHCCC